MAGGLRSLAMNMDIARPNAARQRRRRQVVYVSIGVVLVALVTMGLARLKPAAPTVERSTVWVDTVKRGSVLRQVRGLGTLVPVEIRWIPAVTEGRVDRILALPGVQVKPDTILLELSNPQLQQEALDADWKLKAAEADYKNLEVQLASQVLAQKSESAKADELSTRNDIEHQRLVNSKEVLNAQLVAKRAEVEQFRALALLKKSQMDGLRVRAGITGVLQ